MKSLSLTTMAIILMLLTSTISFAGEWTPTGPTWSYIKDDGNIATNEWISDGGKTYHFDQNGIMETGWILDNEKWYYLNGTGEMCTNRLLPNGYYIGADGAWVPDYIPQDSSNDSSSGGNNKNSGSSFDYSDSLENGLTDGPTD